MLRQVLHGHSVFRRQPSSLGTWVSLLSTTSRAKSETTEEELDSAREWLANFTAKTIPRKICDVSFSRASGPGGQNVNKTNSKATLRVPLQQLLGLVPQILHHEIRASPYCKVSDQIVIQADSSRKQTDNTKSCFDKLHEMILEAGKNAVRGKTSQGQKDRVIGLQNAAKQQRLENKKAHSSKKKARKSGGGSGDY